MVKRNILMMVVAAGAVGVLAACGGPDKPAKSASDDCPAGTQKQGGDCVAPDEESGPGKPATASNTGSGSSDSSGSGSGSSGSTDSSGSSGSSGGMGGGTTPPAGPKTPYDKDNVEMTLRRAANQVKANCGAATDSEGKATGPWGATKISVTLGRNGHVHEVTIPSPFDGHPVGKCAILAFQNLIFPPYPAPVDSVVNWDIEIVKPANVK